MVKGINSRIRRREGERSKDVDNPESSWSPAIKRLRKMSAYDRAKEVYERIQEQKAQEKVIRQQEREKRQANLQMYIHLKKKRNKALRKCNKKGQPNLGAQVEILLKKLEREEE